MYSLLGWLNVILLVLMLGPYVLTKINQKIFQGKNPSLKTIVKFLRKIHKPTGLILVVLAIIHGYLALGGLRPHTGGLVYMALILTAVMGLLFYLKKKKNYLLLHRFFALVMVLLLGLHLLFPSALYYLMK